MPKHTPEEMASGLPIDADFMIAGAPPPPFDWVREGTSYWIFDETGHFAIPRIGVEAEPHTWDNRRFNANVAFADGRVLLAHDRGPVPPAIDDTGRPAVMGAGPLTFRCIEPFHKWHVLFDGQVVDTNVASQMDNSVDASRLIPLRYEFEAVMTVPANVQNNSPDKFFTWPKGKQRDACSIGLGWRFEQLMSIEGEYQLDGGTHGFRGTGNRVKRRSVRMDGLFLRGHVWQNAVFPDGRAFGFEVRPVHDEGFEPWNEAYVYQDGKMHYGKVVEMAWLDKIIPAGEDVSVTIETELGITRIRGISTISTFRIASQSLAGLNLHQGAVRYEWDGLTAYGMIERSSVIR